MQRRILAYKYHDLINRDNNISIAALFKHRRLITHGKNASISLPNNLCYYDYRNFIRFRSYKVHRIKVVELLMSLIDQTNKFMDTWITTVSWNDSFIIITKSHNSGYVKVGNVRLRLNWLIRLSSIYIQHFHENRWDWRIYLKKLVCFIWNDQNIAFDHFKLAILLRSVTSVICE